MNNHIPTPHIDAREGEIAKTILLPGDPLRAKFIAETYLTDVKQFNRTRNMLGFTGKYQGVDVSVMGTGMGCPSMGIYSYELINFYGCKNLIRTGTCGALQADLKIGDLVLAQGACTTSIMPSILSQLGSYAPICDFRLLAYACENAHQKKIIRYKVGNVLTSDMFYTPGSTEHSGLDWADFGVLAVEMESAILYMNAAMYGARALSILSVSDELVSGEEVSAEVRETAFTRMMEVALDVAKKIAEKEAEDE